MTQDTKIDLSPTSDMGMFMRMVEDHNRSEDGQQYPQFGVTVCRTVEELEAMHERCAERGLADVDDYARLVSAAQWEAYRTPAKKASEQRKLDHLKQVQLDAIARGASLAKGYFRQKDLTDPGWRERVVTHTPTADYGTETREIHMGNISTNFMGGSTRREATNRSLFIRTHDLQPAAVGSQQRTADHPVAAQMIARAGGSDQAVVGQHGDLGQLVRAMSTTSGSAIVPTVWAADVIDRARNLSAVMQAGAQLVPMDAKTVQIGRLTGDPTATFRAEGSAITASDVTLDNVTLTATTMNALVVGSMEWFQDAPNSEALVSEAIAQAMATQLDLVCLYGSITSGAGSINLPTPSNPRGILAALNATASSSVLGAATNGTTQTSTAFWNEILDLLYTPRDYNEQPNALIWNSKAARLYAKSYDTTGQPLQMPAEIAALQRYTSNQVPSYTQGTMTSVATDVFCGDFSQLLIGQRLDLTLQVLSEAYATSGQIGILATWRGDVGLARPRAFSVYKAIKGA